MINTLWLAASNYTTQYDLINAFIGDVGRAAQSVGLPVNVAPTEGGAMDEALRPGALYFNFSPDFPAKAREAAAGRCATPAVLQWLIDHPLTQGAEAWRAVEKLPGYRLLTVSDDDAQLIALHFPGIRQVRCWHGVDPSALCDSTQIEASHNAGGIGAGGSRDIDVLVTGTVLSPEQLAERRREVPAALHRVCDEIVALRLAHPWMAFTQAWDLCAPLGLHSRTHWDVLRIVFLSTTAAVNTRRRLALVKGLDGLNVTVIGRGPWASAGTRGLTVVPEVKYGDLPAWFARARVSLAVSPTQFVHGFSERLLLSLAGGCASATDDRLWVRREFGAQSPGGACIETFAAEQPQACRGVIEGLLADRSRCAALGAAGRTAAAERHLWRHRVQTIAQVASNAGTELGWKAEQLTMAGVQ